MRIKSKLSIILIAIITIACHLPINKTLAGEVSSEAFSLMRQGKWDQAQKVAQDSNNKALLRIVISQKLLDTKYKNNNFAEAIIFLKTNPDWPQTDKIEGVLEQYLNDKTDKQLIIDWFSRRSPKTGKGYKFYALAAAELMRQNQPEMIKVIKAGWIYGEFSASEEKQYLQKFSKHLGQEEHVKRIDELLWQKDIERARSLFHLVSSGHKLAFEACITAINRSSKMEQAFTKVPAKYYTSALLYNYLEAKKREVPTTRSIALFNKVHADKIHADEWCILQLYYAREFIDQKDFANSYKIIQRHFACGFDSVREAEWLSGWLALRFLNNPDSALKHFKKLASIVDKPLSLARAHYWLGRTYAVQGKKELAERNYKEASLHTHTFYGQLAAIELGRPYISLPSMPKFDHTHQASIDKHYIVKAAKLLMKYGSSELAHLYLKAATEHASPEELMCLAAIVKKNGNPYYITDFGKQASYKHILLKDYAFPVPYKIPTKLVEPALVYSLMRQESVFNQYAISSANAMGLMQLIKDTASKTAKKMGIKFDIKKLTQDSQYNMNIGTHHVRDLLKERDGSYILTIASYNTSTTNVNKWIKRFGDPRIMKDYREVIDWLELVPFNETRNYIQRLLEVLQVYRLILNNDKKLYLKEDLLGKPYKGKPA